MPYVMLRRAAATTAAAVLTAVAFAGPAAAIAPVTTAPSPYPPSQGSASTPTAPGFIMSDGRVCDPIRHMGC